MTTFPSPPSGAELLDRCVRGCSPESPPADKLLTVTALASAWLALVLLAAVLL